MAMEVWGIRGIYLVATVLGLSFGAILFLNRTKKGAIPLCVANFAAAFWAFGLFLSTVAWDVVAVSAVRVLYLGVGVAVAATFVFALEYTGREGYVNRYTLAALAIHPIVVTLVAVFNPGDVFFTALSAEGVVGVEQEWGPAFWVHSVYSYTLIAGYVILLFEFVYRARNTLYRGQAAALVAGLVAPAPLNLAFLFGMVEFDTTPVGFIVAAAFYTVAIVRYEYTNLSPVARETVIANVRDGMLVLDTDDQVVDSNPAAREMLGSSEDVIGSSVSEVLDLPEAMSVYEELTADREPTTRTVSYGELYLRIEATSITDDRGRHAGWLFLLEDVTERKRRERDLEQQIEKLDQFASLVSHDLRNPINVAKGYIQQTKATGDIEYLDTAEAATDRMEDIIEDALTLAREGQDVTDPTAVSLESLAREAWETVDTRSANLVVEDDPTIVADGDRLKRLFENLYRNAIEHGAEGADPDPADLTVTVGTVDETSADLTIYVADDGVGIPEDDVDHVFEDGFTTNSDGTGLGLAIVEQIARAHGWEVTATNAGNGGARFEISGVNKSVSGRTEAYAA